jgi:hypothetical protein
LEPLNRAAIYSVRHNRATRRRRGDAYGFAA